MDTYCGNCGKMNGHGPGCIVPIYEERIERMREAFEEIKSMREMHEVRYRIKQLEAEEGWDG